MNIYVGNLPFSVEEEDLRQLFEAFGAVQSSRVIQDRETGRSRGFGFVEMDDAEGRMAVEALDGSELQGRRLKVNESQPREDRRGGGGGGRRRF
ncbi:MAG: RNA-binding protein [Planctomycetota bacterium]|nr:MAG: RNA-binding protein [Planctomycetota bacterium]